MTIRIIADREPYASYACCPESGRSEGPAGPFVISMGSINTEGAPPDILAMPVEDFLSLPPERRSGSAVIAYGDVSAMEEAFALGCLDYMREPWSLRELTARAQRLARPRISFDGKEITLKESHLTAQNAVVPLTETERRIARLLMLNAGSLVTREALGFAIHGKAQTGAHSIETHISSLRNKLECVQTGAGSLIKASRGLGYRLTMPSCG